MNKPEKFWNRIAKNFDKYERKAQPTYRNIIEKTRNYLTDSDKVLDFGCGTGLISIEIAGNVQMVHGVDISSKMIEISNMKAIERKIHNIENVCSTIFDERYKSSSFDVIFAFYILHLLEEPQKVLKRIYELLKPDGMIITAIPCLREKPIFYKILSIGGKIGIIPKIKPFKISELENIFKTGNFKIIETECLHQNLKQYFIAAKKQ
ncbi:MAG: class I SAM-dependent methyltransferase [Ignavibacteriae bacterium]|nr:class I SAM-dependent methyltransferase [Ignavibacteriota bacterium]